jgi:hypothetical protein
MIGIFILLIILILVGVAMRKQRGITYPLLKGRSADPCVWRFGNVDSTITAAYLEAVADAFMLDEEELFKLRPEDSLRRLYKSRYTRHPLFSTDSMELEIFCTDFKNLCGSPEAEFDPDSSLRDQIELISRFRNNRPFTERETNSLGLEMKFLAQLEQADNQAIF